MSDDALTFTMVPKKGFFGIGKSKAECFTCPKEIYPQLKEEFNLSSENLQQDATLVINEQGFPLMIRLINMNRSKVRKLLPSKLGKRETMQFSWKSHSETQKAIKKLLSKSYETLQTDHNAKVEPVTFYYLGNGSYGLNSKYPGKIERNTDVNSNELNSFDDFIIPIWQILNQYDELSKYQIDDMVASQLALTDEQKSILHKDGPRTSFDYRMSWARTYLKQAGVSTNPKRGFWKNTELGKNMKSLDIDWVKLRVTEFQKSKNQKLEIGSQTIVKQGINVNNGELRINVPSNFVSKKIKLADDNTKATARLKVTSVEFKQDFNAFFGNWHPMNTYGLNKVESLLFLQDIKTEFTRSSTYREVSRSMYRQLSYTVENLDDNRIDLHPVFDNSSCYLKGDSEAWQLIRAICLPKITDLSIKVKNKNEDGSIDFVISPSRRVGDDVSVQEKITAVKGQRNNPSKFNVGDEFDIADGRVRIQYIDSKSGVNMLDVIMYHYIHENGDLDGIVMTMDEKQFQKSITQKIRSDAGKKAARTKGAKKQKRSDAAKKAARTRAKNKQKRADAAKKGALTRRINKNKRTIPNDLKDRIWQRDKGMCQANYRIDSRFDKTTGEVCGSKEFLEYDHIVPFSKGGKTTYRNLQLLCRTHNRMKSDKDL
ncbi:HNH endonuclease [Candidatus Poseidoniaceae archaeon]|nr:HNH endonuclease [Candidatus Poseidoniaceae archaeon]